MTHQDKIPDALKEEYKKYLKDPRKYKKMYPISYRILMDYIGDNNGQEKD